ncbi:MAG: glycyl-radical enzyme activating protein [Clostridiales bacterium]|nr:glycyl-radical enzyme activating protein [Candidatus Crickella merdequi]
MNHITNIQKFSIHDGDGIRTTVFFKGCPLKCQWCHNPETQRYEKEMQLDASKCASCGSCAKVCPNGAISMTDGLPEVDKSKCTFCEKCTVYCPADVREVVGKDYDIRSLMKELKKDLMFYEDSGGGVTLSGGEVMAMDIDYILQIAKMLKKEDITLTIDTCGFAPYEKFEAILPYVNTFLYDVKMMDPELHKEYIGVDNELILENLVKLAHAGARIYIRIPTIKGLSGTVENMQKTIDFMKENDIHPAQVNLLPYHDTGSHKYAKVGMTYQGTELEAPTQDEMEAYVEMFKNAGYSNTRIGG